MTVQTLVFYAEERPAVGRIVSVFKADADSATKHADRRGLPWLLLKGADQPPAAVLIAEHFVDLSGPAPALAASAPIAATWNPAAGILTGLPTPCTVRLLGEAHMVEDGVADLSALPAGDYELMVLAAGYVTQVYKVTR